MKDDTLADLTAGLDPEGTRQAQGNTLKHAKRNPAFECTTRELCPLCHVVKDTGAEQESDGALGGLMIS